MGRKQVFAIRAQQASDRAESLRGACHFAELDRLHQFLAGLAVLADMLLTTHFMALVMLTIWRLPMVLVLLFYLVFTPIEATYWSSTLEKVPTGALTAQVSCTQCSLLGLL